MNEDTGWFVFASIVCIILGLVGFVGYTMSSAHYQHLLKGVGIERIEECHNVHSNWCEIVWIKK